MEAETHECTFDYHPCGYSIFVGILLSNYLPIDMQVIPVIADLVLMYCGILNVNDVKNFMNIDTLFMLAGVLPLATAMQKTGAGTVVADFILSILGGNPAPITVLIAFYLAGAVLTQFMSNTATQNIFVTLAVVTALNLGLDPRAFCIAIYAGCTAAMMTPDKVLQPRAFALCRGTAGRLYIFRTAAPSLPPA